MQSFILYVLFKFNNYRKSYLKDAPCLFYLLSIMNNVHAIVNLDVQRFVLHSCFERYDVHIKKIHLQTHLFIRNKNNNIYKKNKNNINKKCSQKKIVSGILYQCGAGSAWGSARSLTKRGAVSSNPTQCGEAFTADSTSTQPSSAEEVKSGHIIRLGFYMVKLIFHDQHYS